MRNVFIKTAALSGILLAGIFSFTSCKPQKTNKTVSIAVFVPGIMADSPIYANLVKGIQNGVEEYNTSNAQNKASITVFEAGTKQSDWSTKLTAIAAEGTYNVIFSSNPSLPALAAPLTEQFPEEKFILLDADLNGNQNISTVHYDQRGQAYLSGCIAALMSKTHKIGLISAQEYPVMNNVILPFYKAGAQFIDKSVTVDFRIVGNWYDASKSAELARAMYSNGEDVILPICGGASQGVISAASELGFYLNWFDENAYSKAPGHVISCIMADQEKLGKEMTIQYLNGQTPFGTSRTVGLSDGYIKYIDDDEQYLSTVPENIRTRMSQIVSDIKDGKLILPTE